MPSPRLTGTRDQKQKKAKAEQSAESLRLALLWRARCALLRLHRVPITLRRQRTKRPARVGAMDRADSAIAHGCAISGTRPMARTFRAEARRAQCSGAAFLWLLSCRCRQESDPLARRASGSSALHVRDQISNPRRTNQSPQRLNAHGTPKTNHAAATSKSSKPQ